MKSKYFDFRLQKKDWKKRIIRDLYKKYVNEPYYPEGRKEIVVRDKTLQIRYKPDRFVPGNLEDYFFDGRDVNITIL